MEHVQNDGAAWDAQGQKASDLASPLLPPWATSYRTGGGSLDIFAIGGSRGDKFRRNASSRSSLFNEARLAVSAGRRFGRNMRLWVPASIGKVRARRRYAASKPPTGHPHSVGGASGALAVVRLRPSPSLGDEQWSLVSSGSGPIWLARDSVFHVPAPPTHPQL